MTEESSFVLFLSFNPTHYHYGFSQQGKRSKPVRDAFRRLKVQKDVIPSIKMLQSSCLKINLIKKSNILCLARSYTRYLMVLVFAFFSRQYSTMKNYRKSIIKISSM